MEAPEHEDTDKLDPGEAGRRRPTTSAAPAAADGGDPEPTPGEDPGPFGNPAQDEESLSHEQQDAD